MSYTDRDLPACPTGKITHLTRAQAAKAVRETPRDFRGKMGRNDRGRLVVYGCPRCLGYHIGHHQPKKRGLT